MHEISLAGSILGMVEASARREGFRRVGTLRVEVGRLSGVEPQALHFALESLAPGTCLQGAEVVIDEPEGRAWCAACNGDVPMQQRGEACPHCGGYGLVPTGGTELRVVELLVHDD